METEIDKAGRLLVPASLRQRLEMGNAITILGCGEYLELWDTEHCNDELETVNERYPDLLQSLTTES